MKKRNKLLGFATSLLFIFIFIWYTSNNWSQFQELSFTQPSLLIIGVIFITLNIYCQGMLLDIATEPHGIKLSKKEIFGLASITRFGNYISSGYLGTTARAVFLKKTYGVSYTQFSSSFILSNLLQLIYSGLIALSIFFYHSGFLFTSKPILIISISVILLLSIINLPSKKILDFLKFIKHKYEKKIFHRLYEAFSEYQKVRSHPKLLLRMFLWVIGALISSAAALYLFYGSIGFSIPLISVIFISILGGWSIVFSVTPANIGISEGLLVLGAQLMGVSITATLAVAIIKRLITFLVIFILSSYFTPKLLNTSLREIGSKN